MEVRVGKARDPARVVALYTRDATHQSALIAKIYPELGRLSLNGHHEIGVYARRGLERYTELRFEILTVTEAGDRAAVEYRRHSNLDGAKSGSRARTDSNGATRSSAAFAFFTLPHNSGMKTLDATASANPTASSPSRNCSPAPTKRAPATKLAGIAARSRAGTNCGQNRARRSHVERPARAPGRCLRSR